MISVKLIDAWTCPEARLYVLAAGTAYHVEALLHDGGTLVLMRGMLSQPTRSEVEEQLLRHLAPCAVAMGGVL